MRFFWIFTAIIVGLALFKAILLPLLKGKFGEALVRMMLGKDEQGVKHVINNVTITIDGKSSQIDHVVINNRGVFSIETKNYSGRIYGDENQQQWTQVLAYGKSKHRFYNPLKQNWTHVKRLSTLLGEDVPIYSVVVFVQSNTRYINARNVTGLWGIKGLMADIGTPNTLSSDQIEVLSKQIAELKETNTVTLREHTQNIQQMKEDIQNDICPRCGGKLVVRNGKFGSFYGCENYPKCKFTKNI